MGTAGERVDLLLEGWHRGDRGALEELTPLVYGELRSIASRYRRAENREITLQTTELVHEAFLRLAGSDNAWWRNRAQFFALAARVIRNILVDRVRRRGRQKRGDGQDPLPLADDLPVQTPTGCDLELLDLALIKLEDLDPMKAKIVELRFFGGLSVEETAELMEISAATVKRHWSVARAWLFREIHGELPE
jgi:RNA polymerase sigma factor (TIGR02999 family)